MFQKLNENLTRDRKELETSYSVLKGERDQLQKSYNSMVEDRGQLQKRIEDMTKNSDDLQRKSVGNYKHCSHVLILLGCNNKAQIVCKLLLFNLYL